VHIDCPELKYAICKLTSRPQLQQHLEVQEKPLTGPVQHEVEVGEGKSSFISNAPS